MKRLLINCAVFALIVVAIIGILNRNYYPLQVPDNDNFMAAMIDKHRFAEQLKSPRIIFCGGSNLPFGINSQQVSASTGLPVVNLGLHAGLGLDFMLNEVKQTAKPSDIIIISSEYFLPVDGSHRMKKLVERIFPPAGNYFKPTLRQCLNDYFIEDLQNNLPNTIAGLKGAQRKPITQSVYARSSYNEYGDVVRNFEPNPPHDFLNNYKMDYAYYPGITVLNNFKAYADEKHIRVYFLYPSFPESLYRSKTKVIEKLASDLDQDLYIQILNKPIDSVFPDSLFYNTEYHLNPEGRALRTKRLLPILNALKIKAVSN